MRALSLIGLVLALLLVGVLLKRQLTALRSAPSTPAASQTARQAQEQVRQALDAAAQQAEQRRRETLDEQ